MKRLIAVVLLLFIVLSACTPNGELATESDTSWKPEAPFTNKPAVDAESSPAEEPSKPTAASLQASTPAEAESSVVESKGPKTEDDISASAPEAPSIQKLVIPEGYTLARIGMTLEAMDLYTTEEFIAATQTGDWSAYPLVAAQKPNSNRAFPLEGYLFPDTYDIYTKDSLKAIIDRLLAHTEAKITPELRTIIAGSGYTVDEILTLASIIEKEAFGKAEMATISSVLHNRLDSGMKLQCDVTITYVEGAIKPFITGDVDRYNDYYNTYKAPALPAGPICNPSLSAIEAALSPASTEYLYFLTDKDKNYYYTADYEEHKENVKKYITSTE